MIYRLGEQACSCSDIKCGDTQKKVSTAESALPRYQYKVYLYRMMIQKKKKKKKKKKFLL